MDAGIARENKGVNFTDSINCDEQMIMKTSETDTICTCLSKMMDETKNEYFVTRLWKNKLFSFGILKANQIDDSLRSYINVH